MTLNLFLWTVFELRGRQNHILDVGSLWSTSEIFCHCLNNVTYIYSLWSKCLGWRKMLTMPFSLSKSSNAWFLDRTLQSKMAFSGAGLALATDLPILTGSLRSIRRVWKGCELGWHVKTATADMMSIWLTFLDPSLLPQIKNDFSRLSSSLRCECLHCSVAHRYIQHLTPPGSLMTFSCW